MINITQYQYTLRAPDIDHDDFCPDESEIECDEIAHLVTFRELVEMMREYCYASESPIQNPENVWLISENSQDYITGDYVENNLHFAGKESQRKYWAKALRFAGFIKNIGA